MMYNNILFRLTTIDALFFIIPAIIVSIIIVYFLVTIMKLIFFKNASKKIKHNSNLFNSTSDFDKSSPEKIDFATLVGKRTNNTFIPSTFTPGAVRSSRYYLTFQLEDGDRIELKVTGVTYGMLVEGDCGQLRYRNNQYIDFERKI